MISVSKIMPSKKRKEKKKRREKQIDFLKRKIRIINGQS